MPAAATGIGDELKGAGFQSTYSWDSLAPIARREAEVTVGRASFGQRWSDGGFDRCGARHVLIFIHDDHCKCGKGIEGESCDTRGPSGCGLGTYK